MSSLDGAIEQMLAAGMPPFPSGGPRVNTAAIVRYGPKKRAWYRLYEYIGRNGRSYISGAFGVWGELDATKVETDWSGVDEAERKRLEAITREAERLEREKRKRRAEHAANRAKMQWTAANHLGGSDYLTRKQVRAEKGMKFQDDGTLLVPMIRYDLDPPKLMGLQKIAPDGSKRFNAGMAKEGAACRLGAAPADGKPILIAEGLATALSIRVAIGKRAPVYVAFDCGNLLSVARALRNLFASSPIVFCADDDYLTVCDRHRKEGVTVAVEPSPERPEWCRCNPGRMKADAAADAVGNAIVVYPQFVTRAGEKRTDFNDLHCCEGIEQVTAQIDAALALASAAPRERGKKKRKKIADESFDWKRFFQRFTFIYPTDTAWDAELGRIVKVSAMSLMFGKGFVKYWLESPDRKTVNADDVVFDPAGRADPDRVVNLFRGMPARKSSSGSCELLRELLQHLCGEDDQDIAPATDWVLKWIAYPLQHVGAKMQTAVVMHGSAEGAGKNLFWGAIRSMYGEYGSLITQTELESPYNAWMSMKLFMIANEVISRVEMRHHVGRLKNIITESPLPISEKYLPTRYEENHMNMVFLTNEIQALQLGPRDRRYMVIRTPSDLRDDEFYAAVGREIAAGGVDALHDYLLALDLGDFGEHTKPIMTQAKEDMIELGLSSTQHFWTELHGGLLSPLPYGPCFTGDMFRAYVIWCGRNGVKNPVASNRFSHEFMSMNGVTRKIDRVPDPDEPFEYSLPRSEVPRRTIFKMGPRSGDDELLWIKSGVRDFRSALREWRRKGDPAGSREPAPEAKRDGERDERPF